MDTSATTWTQLNLSTSNTEIHKVSKFPCRLVFRSSKSFAVAFNTHQTLAGISMYLPYKCITALTGEFDMAVLGNLRTAILKSLWKQLQRVTRAAADRSYFIDKGRDCNICYAVCRNKLKTFLCLKNLTSVTCCRSICLAYEARNYDYSYKFHRLFSKIWGNSITYCVDVADFRFSRSRCWKVQRARRFVSSTVRDSAVQSWAHSTQKLGGQESPPPPIFFPLINS